MTGARGQTPKGDTAKKPKKYTSQQETWTWGLFTVGPLSKALARRKSSIEQTFPVRVWIVCFLRAAGYCAWNRIRGKLTFHWDTSVLWMLTRAWWKAPRCPITLTTLKCAYINHRDNHRVSSLCNRQKILVIYSRFIWTPILPGLQIYGIHILLFQCRDPL